MATPTNTSVSRATGENDGTSSEDGSSAGKTKPTSTQVGFSPGNTGEENNDCTGRNTGYEDAARGSKTSRLTPAPARTITTTPSPLAAPKLSKDELRALVVKLEGSNAMLKAKSRDMNRTIKAANSRIAELETELAELREQAAATQAAAKPVKEATASRAAGALRKAPIDPGDAVPPGVAVEEPQPLDEEADQPGMPWRNISPLAI